MIASISTKYIQFTFLFVFFIIIYYYYCQKNKDKCIDFEKEMFFQIW